MTQQHNSGRGSAVDEAQHDIALALQRLERATGRPVESISIEDNDITTISCTQEERLRSIVIRMRDPYELSRWSHL